MLIARIRQLITDFRLERQIRWFRSEYVAALKANKLHLARAIRDDIVKAENSRSAAQLARMDAKALAAADPHARPFVVRQCRDRQA